MLPRALFPGPPARPSIHPSISQVASTSNTKTPSQCKVSRQLALVELTPLNREQLTALSTQGVQLMGLRMCVDGVYDMDTVCIYKVQIDTIL